MNLLDNHLVVQWCFRKIHKTNDEEKKWGNDILNKHFKYHKEKYGDKKKLNKQWTTKLCEQIVYEVLIKKKYKNIKSQLSIKSTKTNKTYKPDFECDTHIFEVKGRNWTTAGTAGEKILAVPIKYAEIPELTGKILNIILVGFQEEEAKKNFACGNILNLNNCNEKSKDMINYFKKFNISYIGLTELLKELGYKEKSDNELKKEIINKKIKNILNNLINNMFNN